MTTPPKPSARSVANDITWGLLMMFLSVLLSPVADIFSKLAAETIPPAEVTAARFIFQWLFALPMMALRGSGGLWSWRQSAIHAARGCRHHDRLRLSRAGLDAGAAAIFRDRPGDDLGLAGLPQRPGSAEMGRHSHHHRLRPLHHLARTPLCIAARIRYI
jgi:hypothetical protein